jgi:hypothetical protein
MCRRIPRLISMIRPYHQNEPLLVAGENKDGPPWGGRAGWIAVSQGQLETDNRQSLFRLGLFGWFRSATLVALVAAVLLALVGRLGTATAGRFVAGSGRVTRAAGRAGIGTEGKGGEQEGNDGFLHGLRGMVV